MHDLESVCFHLGMNIERNREHHTINIHQHSYIRTILAKFRLDESRPVATPMAMKLPKRKPDEEACDPTIYQSMIGSLMHAMTATWPNIPDAIGVFSRYNHDASNEHMVALKRMFRYLNGTKDWRLRFGGALAEVHSEEKEKAHLDVMSIRTMLDAWITINPQADRSSPSEERSTGDRENRSRLPSPRPMPNTRPLD